MRFLILCGDEMFQELLEEVLSEHDLDFISDAHLLSDKTQMRSILEHDSFDRLLISNLHIPVDLALEHLRLLPDIRTYRAIMLSGVVTDEVRTSCEAKGVALLPLPVKMDTLCQAVA